MKITKKHIILVLTGIVAVIFLIVMLVDFTPSKEDGKHESIKGKIVVLPEAETEALQESKSEAYRSRTQSQRNKERYFDELQPETASQMSLVTDNTTTDVPKETKQISAENVMAELFQEPSLQNEVKQSGVTKRPTRQASTVSNMSPEERLEYDRKRAEMMRDVLTGESSDNKAQESSVSASEPLNVQRKQTRSVIHRIGDETSHDEDMNHENRLIKCVFTRNEKIRSGQRVSVRILEECHLGNIVIPANTHLSAICTISDRLRISIKSIEYGGRIYEANLTAYDFDGSAGIYCPDTGLARNKGTVINNAVSTATSSLGGMMGRVAGAALNTGATLIRSATGETTVSVIAGYQFYLKTINN